MAQSRVWFGNQSGAAGPVTGTLDATEGADTFAATGTVLVQGALSATEGADVFAAAGTVTVIGSGAASEAADTFAATGTVLVQGTLAATEAADTFAATGSVESSSTRLTAHVGAKKYRPRFAPAPLFDEAPVVEVAGRFTQPRQITSGDIVIANPVAFQVASGQQRQDTSGEVAVDLSPIIRRRKIQLAVLLAA